MISISTVKNLGTKLDKALSELIVETTGRLNLGVRRQLVGQTRKALNSNAPYWARGLFSNLKSEVREISAPKVGSGINIRYRPGKLSLSMYADDTKYNPGSEKYGYNQYWAVQVAMFGRDSITVSGDNLLALPKEGSNKARNEKGWAEPIFTKHVDAVVVDPMWVDNAMDEVLDFLVRKYG